MYLELEADGKRLRPFSLSEEFLSPYEDQEPPWGPMGAFTYARTYSRPLPDGTQEVWWQTVRRVVETTYTVQKLHCRRLHLPWDDRKAQRSAQEMYERIFTFKFLPPGRGLWSMDLNLLDQKGAGVLYNCAFRTTQDIDVDFADPFCFLMDFSMLGVGVGMDTRGAGKVQIRLPELTDIPFVVEDSREGWVDLVRTILSSFVGRGRLPRTIDYSRVRPRGAPLRGFGGVASGPEPLQRLIENICRVLLEPLSITQTPSGDYAWPQGITTTLAYPISSTQVVDLANYIGKCLPGDTWVMTVEGPRQVKDLVGLQVDLVINGQAYPMESEGFFHTGEKQVYRLETDQGWKLRLTADHKVLREDQTWVEAQKLQVGDRVVLHEHNDLSWGGEGSENEGYVLGMLVGDGSIRETQWGDLAMLLTWDQDQGSDGMRIAARRIVEKMPHRTDWAGWNYNGGEGRQLLSSKALTDLAARFGIIRGNKTITNEVERASSAFAVGFLRGLFDSDASVNSEARSITLYQKGVALPEAAQRMLGRLGILSSVYYAGRADEYVLYIGGMDAVRYMDRIGFTNSRKEQEYRRNPWVRGPYSRRPVATVRALVRDGVEPVYDVTVSNVHAFDANGFYVHNCVVAGGIRRSSEILFGESTDIEFLDLKQDQEALSDRRWASNNSVFAKMGSDYTPIVERLARNGEPGVAWIENMRQYGRMIDPPDGRDYRVMGLNPCFSGDTLIAVADGRGAVPIRQLAKEGNDVPVYSLNSEGKVEIRIARHPRLTRESARLVEIFLDDGTSLRVTPDHKMVLLDGSECEAKDLQRGDSLPRLTKRLEAISPGKKYLRLSCDTRDTTKDKLFEHRLIARFHDPERWDSLYDEAKRSGWISGGIVVHHKNFDRTNNAIENLEILTFDEHRRLHARLSDGSGSNNPMWGRTQSEETREKIRQRAEERCSDPLYREKLSKTQSPETRQASSQRMTVRQRERLLAYWKRREATTDLETTWIDGRLHVIRYCESCSTPRVLPWGQREHSYCSVGCANRTPRNTAARAQGQAVRFADRQRQTLHEQISVYKDLEQELARAPSKKEWESRCRQKKIPIRFRTDGTTSNPYALKGYRHLQEVSQSYNHRVVEVRWLETEEPVYNLTVDQNHTVGIVTHYNPDTRECSGIFTYQCGEIPLDSGELCNLVETFPAHHDCYEDYQRTLKLAYLYAKTVTLIPTHNLKTNSIIMRNRRIGCSMSGIVQAIQKLGRRPFLEWCDRGYRYLQNLDRIYAEWLCIPRSIKTTTVKPSGTTSLLAGATPGIHFPEAEYYIRNIRVQNTSPLVEACRQAGYRVEPDHYAPDTSVVSFPVKEPYFVKSKHEVSMWEQLALAADLQRYWADNAVSVTVTFQPGEVRDLKSCLEAYEDRLKSVSLLPVSDHGYVQAPYIPISEQEYLEMIRDLKPLNLTGAKHEQDEKFCNSDRCELPFGNPTPEAA